MRELERTLNEGIGLDDFLIEGFARTDAGDMVTPPDPDFFRLLSWRPQGYNPLARMYCDILLPVNV